MKLILSKMITLSLFTISVFSITANASSIPLNRMIEDVRFLADDKLAGRAAFSPEIDQAADYIAKRFSEIGLRPLTGEKDFKQRFSIYQISADRIECQLNDLSVDSDKVMLLTSREKLIWNNPGEIKIETITAEQDFRERVSLLNHENANMLILVDPAHAEIFARYRQFFANGLNKLKINQGPSAVFVLTNITNVKKLSVEATSKIISQSLTNVVGILPGESHADENVIFSAHYDHLGSNPELSNDVIFNGADDDATGTTAVINLAAYFSQQKNIQRSLIFVAFTAEEIGGFGSQYFSAQLKPESITAMINIEMIGKPSKFGAGKLWMTGIERSNLAELLNINLTDSQILADPYPEQHLFYRSDNATLARLGVPAHSFSSSQIDHDPYYHQVGDEFSTIDLNSMHQIIETLAIASKNLVEGSASPTRLDTSQVQQPGYFY